MFWLRWIFFSSPLWLGFGGAWLFRTVAEFQLTRESDALVHAIVFAILGLFLTIILHRMG